MTPVNGPSSTFDFAGLGELRAKASNDPKSDEAIKKASQQFEALFLQMMLKSMRDAMPEGGLFDSKATETFEQMYDQQIVMAMSERGSTGLAEMIEAFIRKSQGAVDADSERFISLDKSQETGLPLSKKSDRFALPEGATHQFLLDRAYRLVPGGDL